MTEETVTTGNGEILVTRRDSQLHVRRGDGAVRVDCSWVLDASTNEWFRFSALFSEWDYLEALKAVAAGVTADVVATSGSVLRLSRIADGMTGFEMLAGTGPLGRTLYLRLPIGLEQLAFLGPGVDNG